MSDWKRLGTRRVSQWAPISNSGQVPNSAGGYAWAVDDWARLAGSGPGHEGGSYYATERKLTLENARAVERCVAEDGGGGRRDRPRHAEGRAPKNDPALFALAMAAASATRRRARRRSRRCRASAAPARTCSSSRRSSRASAAGAAGCGGRSPLVRGQPVDALAYQAVKYRQRDGVTHRDLLRLAHPAAP